MSTCNVIAGGLWVTVISLLVAAWVTVIWGPPVIAGMLAATACATSAVAAVAQIRCYSLTVCRNIRVLRAEVQSCRPEVPTMRGV